jgi:hypothetical protein
MMVFPHPVVVYAGIPPAYVEYFALLPMQVWHTVNAPIQFLLADADLLCGQLDQERVDVLLPVRIG